MGEGGVSFVKFSLPSPHLHASIHNPHLKKPSSIRLVISTNLSSYVFFALAANNFKSFTCFSFIPLIVFPHLLPSASALTLISSSCCSKLTT